MRGVGSLLERGLVRIRRGSRPRLRSFTYISYLLQEFIGIAILRCYWDIFGILKE